MKYIQLTVLFDIVFHATGLLQNNGLCQDIGSFFLHFGTIIDLYTSNTFI